MLMGGMRNWELGIGKWFNRVCNPVNHANPRNPGFYHLPLLIGGQAGGYGNPTMVSLELKDGDKLTVVFSIGTVFRGLDGFFRLGY